MLLGTSRMIVGHRDERKRGGMMASTLSDWAREFLREDRVGVVGTLNADGSPHLTTM